MTANLLWVEPTEEEWRKIQYEMIIDYLKADKKLAKMVAKFLNPKPDKGES